MNRLQHRRRVEPIGAGTAISPRLRCGNGGQQGTRRRAQAHGGNYPTHARARVQKIKVDFVPHHSHHVRPVLVLHAVVGVRDATPGAIAVDGRCKRFRATARRRAASQQPAKRYPDARAHRELFSSGVCARDMRVGCAIAGAERRLIPLQYTLNNDAGVVLSSDGGKRQQQQSGTGNDTCRRHGLCADSICARGAKKYRYVSRACVGAKRQTAVTGPPRGMDNCHCRCDSATR